MEYGQYNIDIFYFLKLRWDITEIQNFPKFGKKILKINLEYSEI